MKEAYSNLIDFKKMSNANLRSTIIGNEKFNANTNSEKRNKYVQQSPLFNHHGSLISKKNSALNLITQIDVKIALTGRKKDPPIKEHVDVS